MNRCCVCQAYSNHQTPVIVKIADGQRVVDGAQRNVNQACILSINGFESHKRTLRMNWTNYTNQNHDETQGTPVNKDSTP